MKKTLRKEDKLRNKSEFDYMRNHGTKYVSSALVLVVAMEPPDQKLRCGVICGRKFSLLAVDRNRARRLFWESFRLLKSRIKTCRMIAIPRRRISDLKQADVQKQLETLLLKANVLE